MVRESGHDKTTYGHIGHTHTYYYATLIYHQYFDLLVKYFCKDNYLGFVFADAFANLKKNEIT